MPTEGPGEIPQEPGREAGRCTLACIRWLEGQYASQTERAEHEQAGSGETA